MACRRALRVLLLALLGIFYAYGLSDECSGYESCDECIAGFDCVWCPDLPPFSGPRCTRPQNANCSSELEDPVALPPIITRNDSLGETVQIKPQAILLNLRTGEPQTFTLSVKPARNYPLDMYFLMDLSGSQAPDLEILRNLSTSITEELEDISSKSALGFGSFVDKIAYPYASTLQNGYDYLENHLENRRIQCANGRHSCDPTYTYRHHLSLNNNSLFTDVLNRATIRGNLDSPEATLEALLQTVVCKETVGWRNDSLRIVMVLTDARFKTALDGKVAALLTRNDGECHLEYVEEVDVESGMGEMGERGGFGVLNEGGFYQYNRDPEQDFPSVYQVRQRLIENDIITIFAVAENITKNVSVLYTMLAKELGSSRSFFQKIRNDSSDIVSVIRQAYESVTQDIVVEGISGLTVAITPGPNCKLTSDGMGCANVSVEQLVEFNVTVTMERCLSEKSVSLSLPGFGSVELTLVPICECNCSSLMAPEHPACNNEGSLVCGICDCVDGAYGEQCDCSRTLSSCPNDCFNRGICDNCTRRCISCDPGYYGSRCQCVSGCPTGLNNAMCSGRGACDCDPDICECTCDCENARLSGRPYSGRDCSCDPDNCYNVEYLNRQCAHSRDAQRDGTCECDVCQCPSNSVHYNRTCLHEDDLCAMFESCARCWPSNCSSDGCYPKSLDDITGGGNSVSCQFDQDDCIVDYDVVLSGPFNTIGTVYVGEERDCQSSNLGQLAWIIAVSIIGGILLLGVILLVVFKLILMAVDRKEYKKFLNEMNTGDFTPHSNPLYVTPETEYKNPTLRKKREEDPDD